MKSNVVEYTNKLITFREEIRKHEIEQIFIQKRKNMQSVNNRELTLKMSRQLTNLYKDLLEAQQQQGYEDFINNKRIYYSADWLYQFTSRDVSYQLQYIATSILAEYYCISNLQIPSQFNLKSLLDCFSQSQNDILTNCIFMLDIILDNFRQLKEILIQKFNFVELINQKIEKYRNQQNMLQKLLQMVYRLLNLSQFYQAYSKLLHPMGNLIKSLEDQSTPFTKKINLTAIFNFHLLVKIDPEINYLSRQIVQANLLDKLIRLVYKPDYTNNRLFFVILDLIQICRQSLKEQYIKQQIIPLIMKIRNINFQYGYKSFNHTSQIIKTKAYSCLLYLTQNKSEIAHQLFLANSFLILRTFLQQLRFQQNPKIAELLAKILFCVSFWIKEQIHLIELIKHQIKKTLNLNNCRCELQMLFSEQDYNNSKLL